MQPSDFKILVVDDELVIRSLFKDLLVDEGYGVETVCNGQEGIDAVRGKNFNVVFMDVHMPVKNGLEALIEMKKIRPGIAIVMMDSFPDQLAQEAQDRGAITCIHKPFHIKEVLDIISNLNNQNGGVK